MVTDGPERIALPYNLSSLPWLLLDFFHILFLAPYVKIDMNPVVNGPDSKLVYKDAVFISTHKFVGG